METLLIIAGLALLYLGVSTLERKLKRDARNDRAEALGFANAEDLDRWARERHNFRRGE